MTKEIKQLSDLQIDPYNANRGTERGLGMLEDSIRQNGLGRSILVDRNGVVIGGNKTLERAVDLGFDDVIVVPTDGTKLVAVQRTDLDLETDPRARRMALADNRVGQIDLDFDPAVLAELAAEDDKLLSGLWSEDELAALLATMEKPDATAIEEGEDQTDRAAELQVKWNTQEGQVWTIGRHRLMCGDALRKEDVARLMNSEQPQMVFCDPPYGISIVATNGYVGGGEAYDIPFGGRKKGYVGGGEAIKASPGLYPIQTWKRGGLGTADGSKPFGSKAVRGTDGASNVVAVGKYLPVKGDDTTDSAIGAYRLLSSLFPDAVHIWWGGNYYANALPASSCWIVWDKENTGNFADCELAWTNQPTAVRLFRHRWNGMLKESEQGQRRIHPTQKPVALAAWCIEKYGQPGGIVLDTFAGSGISGMAAEQMGMAAYMMEAEAGYCAAILERLAGMGLSPVLADG